MFCNCSSLKSLNLINFNIKYVIDMGYMFKGCKSLIDLDLSNFDISHYVSKDHMFSGCSNALIKKVKSQNSKLLIKDD